MPDDKKKLQRDGRYGVYGSPRPMQRSDFPLFPQTLRLTDPTLRRIVMRNPRLMVTDPPYSNDSRYGPKKGSSAPTGSDYSFSEEGGPYEDDQTYGGEGGTDKKKSLDMFNSAWGIVKDDMAGKKKALIACLKKEGGACSLDECCKACDMDRKSCKALIDSMDNVKIHPEGDVILMDGL